MSSTLVYLCVDADKISNRVESAITNSDPDKIAHMAQDIERGDRILRGWLEDNGGKILLFHGDEIYAMVPGEKLTDLGKIHGELEEAWNDTITIGVGLDLHEASRALKAGKKKGGSRIVFYAPEVEEMLDEDEHSESHDAKEDSPDPYKLKELDKAEKPVCPKCGAKDVKVAIIGEPVYVCQKCDKKWAVEGELSKANSPSPGPPTPNQQPDFSAAGGGGMSPPMEPSPFGPPQGTPSGGPSQMPPPPSTTDMAGGLSPVEAQFRDAANQGEAENARSEAQATSADDGDEDAKNVDALKEKIAKVLKAVQKQAPLLEQLKQQAPEAYQAIMAMVQAMMVMAKQLISGDGEQQEPQEKQSQEVTKSEELIKGDQPPKMVPVKLEENLEGELPEEIANEPREFIPRGINQSAYFLRKDRVLKVIPHSNPEKANKYLKMIARLKQLKLSHIVPIHDIGVFSTKAGNIYTFETMKRLKPLEGGLDAFHRIHPEVEDALSREGWYHGDLHSGNLMQDSLGQPRVIDLESFDPEIRLGNNPVSDVKPGEEVIPPPKQIKKGELSKAVKTVPTRIRAGDTNVTGKLPVKIAKEPRRAIGSGINRSAYFLGKDKILKIMPHNGTPKANKYLKMINRLKALKLSHIVPIYDTGVFHSPKTGTVYTFEVMKKLKRMSYNDYVRTHPEVEDALGREGWYHGDLHSGNLMQDSLGQPRVIDLESFDPEIRFGNNPVSPVKARERIVRRPIIKRPKVKKNEGEHIRNVREREDKELASIPIRDPAKGPRKPAPQYVPSIAEETRKSYVTEGDTEAHSLRRSYTIEGEGETYGHAGIDQQVKVQDDVYPTNKVEVEPHERIQSPGLLHKLRMNARKNMAKKATGDAVTGAPRGLKVTRGDRHLDKASLPMPEETNKVPPIPNGAMVERVQGKASPQVFKEKHIDPGEAAHVSMDGKVEGKTTYRRWQSGKVLPSNPSEATSGTAHPVSALNPIDR